MLTDAELQTLYDDIESDRVERKESVADPKKIQQAICAFANDMPGHNKPGVLFVGVRDDGSCANLTIDDQILLTLSQLKMTVKLLPPPTMTVQKKTINGCEIAVIVVEPSKSPPVRFDGRTWIRVGPQRNVATREDEQRLTERRRSNDIPWDLHPCSQATIDDLDLDYFRDQYLPAAVSPEVIAENKRTIEQQLRALRFLAVDENIPTLTGLLAIGKDPTAQLPGAYIQFLRISGTELSDPIRNQRAIRGKLSELILQAEQLIELNIEIETDISGPIETRQSDYPMEAIRQIVRNAVMHRSYEGTNAPVRVTWFDDRIEIISPGGPYGNITIDNFGTPGLADYRNPTIAEVMANLKFVQRFGVGIGLATEAMNANHNPVIRWSPTPTFTIVTLRKRT